tara:strand:+ start:230 stop:697 length:468 start_codon:yes stop_codon:yes gene_type:complete
MWVSLRFALASLISVGYTMKGLSFLLTLLDVVPRTIVVATTGAVALSIFYKFDHAVLRAVLLGALFLGAMATSGGGDGGVEGAISYTITGVVAVLARKLYLAAVARNHVPMTVPQRGIGTLPLWVLTAYMLVETHTVISKIVAGLYDRPTKTATG